MKTQESYRLIQVLVFAIIMAVVAVRFVHLEADFPHQLTWSGILYTDEGWYSSGAIAYEISGNWHTEGDFNPMVNMPIFHVIQAVIFRVLGMTLGSARFTVVLFSFLMILSLYLLLKAEADVLTARIGALLLAINFTVFAYSRLAVLEIPMVSFVALALMLAASLPKINRLVVASLAALVFCLAVLTKPTAIAALPALIYVVWTKNADNKQWQFSVSTVIIVVVTFLAGYYVIARHLYPADFNYFNSLNVTSRITLQPMALIRNLRNALFSGVVIGPLLYPLTVLITPVLLVSSRRFRHNPLVAVSLLWLVPYVLLLVISGYMPPRYFVPLSVPVVILFSVMFTMAYRAQHFSPRTAAAVIGLVVVLLVHGVQIVQVVRVPQYSFRTMALDIRQLIESHSVVNPILMGDVAPSISLIAGTFPINDNKGTRDLNWKMSKYKPSYYVSLGINEPVMSLIRERYSLEEISTYDVLENYYGGKRVHFYRISRRSNQKSDFKTLITAATE